MAGRKRKAGEIEDGGSDREGSIKSSPSNNFHKNLNSSQPAKKEAASDADEPQETIETEASTDTTITVECPVWPKSKRYLARLKREDLYTGHDAPLLPGPRRLEIDYAVKPGSSWLKLRQYKNARFKDPIDVTYSAGEIVYVNRRLPVPAPPSTDASPAERLAYDKENLWVGQIAEFRAASTNKVFVRVFWLYWPDELPMHRQPYHGDRELVMSNHVEIIEAQTIACHADISHWDEYDDTNKTVLDERYWRQMYDVTKMATPHLALSKLRKFCICGGYDNPGVDMFQCRATGCRMWNHENCLIADIEKRAWEKFKTGMLDHEMQEVEENKTFSQKVVEKVGQLVGNGIGVSEVHDGAHSDRVLGTSKHTKLVAGHKKPWARKLEGRITKVRKAEDETTVRATVRQLVPTANTKARPSFEPKIWNMEMNCLRCHHSLN
ncbi:hypothetical protein A1O7_06990 [Cladophialophora yegresii CBS 114405]|uniref:BAH domain-containing protein n=1 Tax=Cladophialophora yegresii CBS 114405 TaxID=1182544 RepID=W9VWP0_9EURO|nr:uncharacterized protein A1O7_06990 [Cladophialophora yegresii CBS 114405]EXJ56646.1 hypothetical protein A1O7_06990 [Cladophialophora yegresii CBS 114405]